MLRLSRSFEERALLFFAPGSRKQSISKSVKILDFFNRHIQLTTHNHRYIFLQTDTISLHSMYVLSMMYPNQAEACKTNAVEEIGIINLFPCF